jgi:magnesium chelatase subunit I
MQVVYPFSALVGQELLKTALLLNAVDPAIGGVLIRGEKGAGKSTAARALAGVLPPLEALQGCRYHCDPSDRQAWCSDCQARHTGTGKPPVSALPTPWIELPLNATEDRLAGTLKIEAALTRGKLEFEPGLLAAANRGVLYVDEVNLLEDHLVDLLLDAAASGVQRVEREGLSLLHPARFILIGSMNPEEGELRPQFIDRFGLCVSVQGVQTRAERVEIARRRLSFDADPAAFRKKWQDQEELIGRIIRDGRSALAGMRVDDEIWQRAAELSERARTQGHRADILLVRAARALAALTGRPRVGPAELVEAARLVLPHRIKLSSLHSPEHGQDQVEQLLAVLAPGDLGRDRQNKPEQIPTGEPMQSSEQEQWEIDPDFYAGMQVPGATAAGSLLFSYIKKKALMRSA